MDISAVTTISILNLSYIPEENNNLLDKDNVEDFITE